MADESEETKLEADGIDEQMDKEYGTRQRSGLRPRKERDYSYHIQKPQDYMMLHSG